MPLNQVIYLHYRTPFKGFSFKKENLSPRMRMMYKNLRIGGLAADPPYGKGKDDLIQKILFLSTISFERVEKRRGRWEGSEKVGFIGTHVTSLWNTMGSSSNLE